MPVSLSTLGGGGGGEGRGEESRVEVEGRWRKEEKNAGWLHGMVWNRGDECATSNKRILNSFAPFSVPFFLSLFLFREAFHAGISLSFFYPCTHRFLVDSRAIDPGARRLENTEYQACMWVQCSRCDHPVVTDGVFPAGVPCVDANLRGGATYRYRSTFPAINLFLPMISPKKVGSFSRFCGIGIIDWLYKGRHVSVAANSINTWSGIGIFFPFKLEIEIDVFFIILNFFILSEKLNKACRDMKNLCLTLWSITHYYCSIK